MDDGSNVRQRLTREITMANLATSALVTLRSPITSEGE